MEFVVFSVVFLLGLGAYWSMIIFPKQREFSKRQTFVRTLNEGDEVITAGGLIGKVLEIRGLEGIAIIEIAPGIQVRAITASLLEPFDPEELAHNIQMAMKDQNPAVE